MRSILRGVLILFALLSVHAAEIRHPERSEGSPGARTRSLAVSAAQDDVIIPVAGITAGQLKSNFDEWRGSHRHHALDILAPRGTPVLAAVDGKVRKLFTSGAGGLTIYETDRAETTIYYYAHLDRYAPRLKEGMELQRGDVIGYVGTSGNAPANTPHLHFAIAVLPPTKEWWKGEPVDPYTILKERGLTVAAGGSGVTAGQ